MARKLCSLCETRPVGSGQGDDPEHARRMGYCAPCMTEAEHENTHNDYGHKDPECVAKGYDYQSNLDQCWMCHPELNLAKETYVKRERKGHHSPRRQQINHRTQCQHAQTPAARRECREAHWAQVAAPKLEVFPARGQGNSRPRKI